MESVEKLDEIINMLTALVEYVFDRWYIVGGKKRKLYDDTTWNSVHEHIL